MEGFIFKPCRNKQLQEAGIPLRSMTDAQARAVAAPLSRHRRKCKVQPFWTAKVGLGKTEQAAKKKYETDTRIGQCEFKLSF